MAGLMAGLMEEAEGTTGAGALVKGVATGMAEVAGMAGALGGGRAQGRAGPSCGSSTEGGDHGSAVGDMQPPK